MIPIFVKHVSEYTLQIDYVKYYWFPWILFKFIKWDKWGNPSRLYTLDGSIFPCLLRLKEGFQSESCKTGTLDKQFYNCSLFNYWNCFRQ